MPSISEGKSVAYQSVTRAIDERPVGFLQIVIFAVCFTLSMLEGYDVLVISFASVSLSEQLGLTSDRLGVLISAGLLGMTIGALFLATLSDLFGRRRMILIALVLSGLSMCATGMATSLWSIALLRVFTGIGIGILLATVTAVVAEFMPERRRSLAVGVATSGYALGATLGGVMSASLINVYGWPTLFYGGGVLTLFMVLVVLWVLPESLQFLLLRQPAGALQRANKTLVKMKLPTLKSLGDKPSVIKRAGVQGLLSEGLRQQTLLLWLAFGLAFGSLYFLFGWIPKLTVDAGVSETAAIYALTFFNLGGLVGVALLGQMAIYAGLSRMILIFMLLGGGLMVAFPFTTYNTYLLLTLCAFLGAMVHGGFVGLYSAAAKLYPPEVRVTGVGWGIGLGRVGAVISPYAAGVLYADGQGLGVTGLFLLFAFILALSALVVSRLRV